MKKIGSWWLAKIEAREDEEVKYSFLANRTQSSNRAVGGKLFITNQRCLFTPHLIDYFTGGKKCEINLSQISEVGVRPAGGDRLGGGLRERLKILHSNGEDLFVVNKFAEVVKTINSVVGENA